MTHDGLTQPAGPFAIPDERRHLRHAFYLRHPELDQRVPRDRDLDERAYAAYHERPAPPRTLARVLDEEDPLDVYDLLDAVMASSRSFGEDVEFPERLPVRAALGHSARDGEPAYAVLDVDPVRGPDGPYLRLRLGHAPPEGVDR